MRDLLQAIRFLSRNRAFTLFSTLALALGLGLNGSLLVVSRACLLRPAPVADPGHLLEVLDKGNRMTDRERDATGSITAYAELRKLAAFQGLALSIPMGNSHWNSPGGIQPVQAMAISHEYLPLLGIHPFLGRGFTAAETGSGAPPASVAMVSHRFWKHALGSTAQVLGSGISLEGHRYTVVGVLPPGFEGHALNQAADVVLPFVDTGVSLAPRDPGRFNAEVFARLSPGTSLTQARATLASLDWGSAFHLELRPYRTLPPLLQRRLGRGLAGLHGAALLILAIGLGNALALQTAQLQRRRPELAVRMALGARPWHLFRLILAENLILALLAGCAALGMTSLATPLLEALQALVPYPPRIPLALGAWTASMTLLLALLLGVLLSGFVFLQARGMDLGHPLKEGRSHTRGWRLRSLWVAAQGALSLVLLCSADLCLRDLRRQMDIPLGMEIRDRYLLECQPELVGRTRKELLPLLPALKEGLRQIPGARGVVLLQGGPVKGIAQALVSRADSRVTMLLAANHDLPAVMGMGLREGRPLEPQDEDQNRVLVSEEYARLMWPGEAAPGRKFRFLGQEREVVGVLRSSRFGGPGDTPEPFLLLPVSLEEGVLSRSPLDNVTLWIPGPPRAVIPAIRAAARSQLKDIPFRITSLVDLRDEALSQPRRLFSLNALMGSMALLLSLSGLYGLSAHLAETRRRELGIRVALGAGSGRILGLLARGSLLPLVPGLGAGALLALATSRLLVHQGEAFPVLDAPALIQASLFLATASALACLVPALGTRRMNPAEVLRSE